jgi:hypothetical protein
MASEQPQQQPQQQPGEQQQQQQTEQQHEQQQQQQQQQEQQQQQQGVRGRRGPARTPAPVAAAADLDAVIGPPPDRSGIPAIPAAVPPEAHAALFRSVCRSSFVQAAAQDLQVRATLSFSFSFIALFEHSCYVVLLTRCWPVCVACGSAGSENGRAAVDDSAAEAAQCRPVEGALFFFLCVLSLCVVFVFQLCFMTCLLFSPETYRPTAQEL